MDPALGLALAVAAGAVVVATVAKLAAELCAAGPGGAAKRRDDVEAGRETTRKWAVVEMPDGTAALARKL